VRAALKDIERAGREAASKEQAAGLVEKALHEAFGEVPDDDDSERARALRALLDDARFVRYAPQLGDYSDKVKDLAARAAEAVRRWA
jgi:ATP-dependent exoDNAse (exonuclease V) alpha subunit